MWKKVSTNNKQSTPWTKETVIQRIGKSSLQNDILGGLFEQHEDVGDCHYFCSELLNTLQSHPAFHFINEQPVINIRHQHNNVTSVETAHSKITGDRYVIVAGVHSTQLARLLGISLPVYPMKGYSVTVPATQSCPDISITDTKTKTVYCRLGDRLRIAGFAEFSGYNTIIDPERIQTLLSNAKDLLPNAGHYDNPINKWCGLLSLIHI